MEIAASITSGDLARLAQMAEAAEAGGADRIHIDIEDGVFVPTFTVGPGVVAAIRQVTRLPLEVHLQTMAPGRWIATIAAPRPDRIIVHPEGAGDFPALLRSIVAAGSAAGLALLLATPVEAALPWMGQVEHVTLMATPPEGGDFHAEVLDKARALRAVVPDIEVDGGVTPAIVGAGAAAGVTTVVAGRAIFGRGVAHIASGIAALRGGR
ncbi:MAG: ribulose-phosphate 3-epimerase [Armatimonadota bacterium]|nr:ribulose-phosphate 3-epimerase [Armatimonadota bacterium]